MILGDVEEVITTVEIDDETYEEIIKVRGWRHIYSFAPLSSIAARFPKAPQSSRVGGPHIISSRPAMRVPSFFSTFFFFWSLFRFFFSNSAASRSRNSH